MINVIQVEVTEKDVRLANRLLGNPNAAKASSCPVALAVRRAAKTTDVSVIDASYIRIGYEYYKPSRREDVQDLIYRFDSGLLEHSVRPAGLPFNFFLFEE